MQFSLASLCLHVCPKVLTEACDSVKVALFELTRCRNLLHWKMCTGSWGKSGRRKTFTENCWAVLAAGVIAAEARAPYTVDEILSRIIMLA